MNIAEFKLERYFAKYEFTTRYLLSCSDCDGYPLSYVLDQATTKERNLWDKLTLGYTESEGNIHLREAISDQYTSISPSEIVVASPGELNFILMNRLLHTGDHVICMSPAYQSLFEVARSLGTELSFWQPNPDNWHFDPDELAALIRPNTRMIIINFPHNPTGAFPSRDELDRIVDLARRQGIYLFSDEMYRSLLHGETEEIPSVCDLYEKGISLWGMAKTFGLAGLRMGWLACKDTQILQQILAFKDYLSICNSAPSEILSLIALRHQDAFVQPNLTKIRKNLSLFQAFVRKHESWIQCIPSQAGSTAFAKLHISESSLDFGERLVRETGIMLVPAEMFEYGQAHIRIGFGRENFSEVLTVFGQWLLKQSK
ncbi:MAG: aminotransferase class I/II-fold pyridoxal phosphate-dependent enzyme [Bacteroidota bacterium]